MHQIARSLRALGWGPAFETQVEPNELETHEPVRIAAVHRAAADALGVDGVRRVETASALSTADLAVGDWALLSRADDRITRRLERRTLLQRRAAGEGREVQLIAANVDTLLIASSCDADFNLARLERYLAIARQSGVFPVIALTKADLCDAPDDFARRAAEIDPMLAVETLDARDSEAAARLAAWCAVGQTMAVLGSSGVGKSTLINTLTGADQSTQGVRVDDAKGRHTTTARSLHPLPGGGWLIDTPGMRALRLTDAADGVAAVFEDIENLSASCKFSDCRHEAEPGCAVQAAIARGDLDKSRLLRWQKLCREDERNSASIAEARARDRALAKGYRAAQEKRRGRH